MNALRNIAICLTLLSQATAFAAETASLNSDARIYANPDVTSPVLMTLSKGTTIQIASKPFHGFYHMRAGTTKGYVVEKRVRRFGSQSTEKMQPAAASPPRSSRTRVGRPVRTHFLIKTTGGITLWSPSDVNTLVAATALNTGSQLGLELGYAFSNSLAWIVRIEKLSKTSSGTFTDPNSDTSHVLALSLNSTSIVTGLQFGYPKARGFSLEGSVLAGMALGTSLQGALDNGTPTQYSKSTFTVLAKLGFDYALNPNFWFYGELGYRYLKTSSVTPASTGSVSSYFQDPNTGQYIPISINLSGPVIGLGIGLAF